MKLGESSRQRDGLPPFLRDPVSVPIRSGSDLPATTGTSLPGVYEYTGSSIAKTLPQPSPETIEQGQWYMCDPKRSKDNVKLPYVWKPKNISGNELHIGKANLLLGNTKHRR